MLKENKSKRSTGILATNVMNKKENILKKVGEEIKQEVFLNVPNILTLIRLLSVFIIIYMLFSGYPKLLVGILFIVAAATDWFDGYLARKLKQTTSIGARLDQIIDRVFAIPIVLALLVYFIMYDTGDIILLFLIISREMIGLPGFLVRLVRNRDTYKVKYIGKITTFVQGFAIAAIILDFSLFDLNWALYFSIITCICGILAGFDYLRDSFN